jgi:Fic family protein
MLKELDDIVSYINSVGITRRCVTAASELFDVEFSTNFTYVSNRIEGNTITRPETEDYVLRQIVPKGRTTVEVQEMENHLRVWEYVKTTVSALPIEEYQISTLLDIHRLLTWKVLPAESAGHLRSTEVRVSNSPLITPKHEEVFAVVQRLIKWLHSTHNTTHPVLLAAAAHIKLAAIHPFSDGNGRSARLLMNSILLHYRYPPTIMRDTEDEDYYKALRVHSQRRNFGAFLNSILQNELQTANRYKELLDKMCK